MRVGCADAVGLRSAQNKINFRLDDILRAVHRWLSDRGWMEIAFVPYNMKREACTRLVLVVYSPERDPGVPAASWAPSQDFGEEKFRVVPFGLLGPRHVLLAPYKIGPVGQKHRVEYSHNMIAYYLHLTGLPAWRVSDLVAYRIMNSIVVDKDD